MVHRPTDSTYHPIVKGINPLNILTLLRKLLSPATAATAQGYKYQPYILFLIYTGKISAAE